ncbi:MAG: glycosyltransferase [Bacteroidales bacterium]|nr:glycosyltransferase [Bacteroidales bacterium]
MTFEHYIVTRFNLPIFQAKVGGAPSKSCDREYLQYRFDLFERYCMPSMVNQTNQNFKWFVLFDANTPQDFQRRAWGWHEKYENLVPCFLNLHDYTSISPEYEDLCTEYDTIVKKYYPSRSLDLDVDRERGLRKVTPQFVLDAIKQCSANTPDYYLTTRIDNDDAFHKDFVKTVQKRFIQNPKHVVYDYVYSYKYILNEGIVYRYPLQNGHFLTLAEPTSKLFQSILYWNHLYIDKFVEVEHIYQQPLQTELIHGNNVVNDFTGLSISGLIYAFCHFRQSDFGYDKVYRSWGRFLRVLAFLIRKKWTVK